MFVEPDTYLKLSTNEQYLFIESSFTTIKIIRGEGRHEVKKCIHHPSQHVLAVKIIDVPDFILRLEYEGQASQAIPPRNQSKANDIKREIEALRRLEHENIVRLYGIQRMDGELRLYMECMDYSLNNLYDVRKETSFSECDIGQLKKIMWHVIISVINALCACHEQGIIHRDIKPANILLNKNGAVKLADFGEARFDEGKTYGGTSFYRPPEIYKGQTYDTRYDIWSMGITVLEFTIGEDPYKDAIDELEMRIKIQEAYLADETKLKSMIPDDFNEFYDLINSCLKNYDERPVNAKILTTLDFYSAHNNCRDEEIVSTMEELNLFQKMDAKRKDKDAVSVKSVKYTHLTNESSGTTQNRAADESRWIKKWFNLRTLIVFLVVILLIIGTWIFNYFSACAFHCVIQQGIFQGRCSLCPSYQSSKSCGTGWVCVCGSDKYCQ